MSEPQPPSEWVKGRAIDGTPAELEVARLTWRPSAYGLIFNEAGYVLVLDNIYNGRLEFPGGGVEIWESLSDAVAREIWEETGFTAQVGEMIHMQEAFFVTPSGKQWHVLQHYFFATITGGTLRNPILEDESATNPHWIDPTTLYETSLTIGWAALQAALTKRLTQGD
ncbi:NUDIX hydrolase [Phototrophicus methaneseepsis]|uniref:NUDIX hydrolase n=1 Tax=Phototrophicus methaneseepsis TaxID=2710758 RepID=A0A7S8IEA2_9CHLR|nr:NUDIX hydrolase [Phototrophicus methaneseepsis]QPC82229.1 NUDIX hydrolase [Phototrophicus methaneseepsis]